jgi:hypothetical protein
LQSSELEHDALHSSKWVALLPDPGEIVTVQSAEIEHAAWHSSEWVACLLPDPGEIVTIC